MEEILEYSSEYKQLWTEFVESCPQSTVAHSIEWIESIQKGLGHLPRYLMATNGSKVTGILPLFLVKTWWMSRYIISIPWIDYGGICAESPETIGALLRSGQKLCHDERASFIEFRSVNSVAACLASRTDKVTFILDLNPGIEKIWKDFDSKLRNQIRKSEKSGLTVTFGGIEYLSEFYDVFARKMRDLGTPVWGRRFFENILKSFPTTARIVLVKKEKETAAGGLLLSFKDSLYMPSAASYPEYLKYCPNHALYWETLKRACEERYSKFDFGRSSLGSSNYEFKKQWAPTPLQLTWQYHLNKTTETPMITPRNRKYEMLRNLWRKLPMPAANFLGPRVIRNFP